MAAIFQQISCGSTASFRRYNGLSSSELGRDVSPVKFSPSFTQQKRKSLQTVALFGKGGPAGFLDSLKQAQQLVQQEAANIQRDLALAEFDGFSEGGYVKVTLSGNQEPRAAEVTEEALTLGAEKLSELINEAYKDAHSKSTEAMKERMKMLASKMSLPEGLM